MMTATRLELAATSDEAGSTSGGSLRYALVSVVAFFLLASSEDGYISSIDPPVSSLNALW